MYIGIDLGTSNSAIVGSDKQGLKLFKTDDGRDVLPSMIYFDRRGHMLVGSRALAQAELSPGNVAQGFKRLMGTSSQIDLAAAGKCITPEDASAEIIKTLLRQIEAELGGVDVSGAIITIPAAFNQMQSEATIKAAHMAGLEKVGLLQEPIAAAMSALEGNTRRDGRFLVYDLGGGTFDVALVEATSGSVTVIAHEGINMLGGRDFDRAIVDSVIRPWLHANFSLPANVMTLPAYKRLFAIARLKAEQAKVELSTKQETVIFLSDEDVRAEDANGEPIYVECPLDRRTLEGLITDRINDSIELCRKILKNNNLSHEDIDRIVFIGGPSKMPIVREHVSTSLGIPADLKCDPMIAVARGAAIFAESREWDAAVGRRKSARGSQSASGEVNLRLDFTARASDQRARLKLRADLPGDGCNFRVTGPEGYDSGFAPFSGEDTISLPLVAMGENCFAIEVIGADGRRLCEIQRIVIVRTEATATAIPATQTVSVKVAKGPVAERRNMLVPLIAKGTPLPAKGTQSLRLRETLIGGEDGRFDVEIYNQAEGVDDPLLNLPIGVFRIAAREVLEVGQRMQAGATVNIHWNMDDNGLIACEVELPDLGLTIQQKNLYVPEVGHRNFDGQEGGELAKAQLAGAKKAIAETREALHHKSSPEIATLSRRLTRMEELLENSNDAEARRAATEEALHIQQELARLRDAPENRHAVMLRDLQAFEDAASELVESLDRAIVERLNQLGLSAREAIGNEDWAKARQIIEQMYSTFYNAMYEQPDFILGMFADVAGERYAAMDKALHDAIVAKGAACAEAGDIDGVRTAIRDILNNRMPNQTGAKKVAVLSGLIA
jgi:molecular chaperone DnaK